MPNGDKLEMRVRGVSVFPGYRDAPQLTAQAFDDEGYYCIGDAGLLADEQRPERGVVFDGRVAEDFKLATGTWVIGRHAARARGLGAGAAGAGRGRHRPRPRRGRRAGLPSAAGRGAAAPRNWPARIAAALRALKAEGGGSSQVPDACAGAGRAAQRRCRRDHRQGLHQPGRRVAPSRHGRGAALFRRPGRYRCLLNPHFILTQWRQP